MKLLIRGVLLCASGLLPLSGLAADALTEAIQKSYAPYRAALYKTNGKSQAEAREVLDQAREGWARVASQFGVRPPPPYDRDCRRPSMPSTRRMPRPTARSGKARSARRTRRSMKCATCWPICAAAMA